jgi:AcrR family transcriptional regulator
MEQIDRRDLILDTFTQLVSRFGIDKTTIQDVAKELGFSSGVIYQEFRNKEALIEACFLRLSRSFIQNCLRTVDSSLPADQVLYLFIKQILMQMNKFIIENRGFSQYVRGEAFLGCYRNENGVQAGFKQELLAIIISILEKGCSQGAFQIESLPKTAELFFDAFYIFFVRLILADQDLEQNLEDTRLMYELLLKGIIAKR